MYSKPYKVPTGRKVTHRLPEDCHLSRQCQSLIRRLLKHNTSERITYEQLFNHPFVDISHQPSPKTYSLAVKLIYEAVKFDSNREFKNAFNTYCDALAYLVPHVQAEKDKVRRDPMMTRMISFMDRAEAILPGTKVLSESLKEYSSVQELVGMCETTPELQSAVNILISGDMFFSDGIYNIAIEKYQTGIEMIMAYLPKEPEGIRKDLILRQAGEWVAQATRAKALYDLHELQKNFSSEAKAVKGDKK